MMLWLLVFSRVAFLTGLGAGAWADYASGDVTHVGMRVVLAFLICESFFRALRDDREDREDGEE